MVVSVQAQAQPDIAADNVRAITQRDLLADEKSDLRMQLNEALQSSLELNTLLAVFLERISTTVKLDGIQYSNDEQGIKTTIAKQSSHSCGYRLITTEDKLGEIIFKRSRKFNEKELSILESLLPTLFYPLRNALSYTKAVNAAFQDTLTGARNISTLQRTLDREVNLSKRHNQPLAILLIDVDRVTALNISYGHAIGDSILKSLSSRIVQLCRTTDAVFRYEDDQFLVLLSNTDKEGAKVIATRIRKSAASMKLPELDEGDDVQKSLLTVSFGISTLTGTDSSSSLIERASRALFSAKRLGKNLIHS
ncbi:MAG: GGDEF domain-containing protein [Gammaproteobacteria bacterium]|nr:GGDEF domain-containing protein [Gammaproteobacteria bacterium]MDP2140886.1 GGDEF domain-containing protein [Gammaproteobacteria bacterium]MDP2349370.1 GGDEF domain-containing protein [Gammaproteobacteria bacterium]